MLCPFFKRYWVRRSHCSGTYPIFHSSMVSFVSPLSCKYCSAGFAASSCVRNWWKKDVAASLIILKRSFSSWLSLDPRIVRVTPALSAKKRRAPTKSIPSISCKKEKISPPLEHPKQCQLCRSRLTINDGDFSLWNGHKPLWFTPAGFSWTYSPTKSTMSSLSLISCVSDIWI